MSYRDLEGMLAEIGVEVAHSTIYRWVQYYAPKLLEKPKWYWET
jgi:transposase-like protein